MSSPRTPAATTPPSPARPRSTTTRTGTAPADPGAAAVDSLERSLTLVGRAILRMGVPPHALRPGRHVDRSGYWVLYRLAEAGGAVHLSELAALLDLDLSTVSRQVRQLVDAGLVVRSSDPVDGRAWLLGLSPRGRHVLDTVRQARRDLLRQALGGWGEAERAALARSLDRLADDLHALGHAGPSAGSPGGERPAP